MHKRGLCCRSVSVCPSVCLSSVCLSVTFMYCIQTAKIASHFLWPDIRTILASLGRLVQGRLQGGVDATCVQIVLREENYTLKGEEFPQIYGLYVKSETLDSCRFETKMCQNAPNPISISIFPGVTPGPRHWGLCPQTPVEGRKGKGGKGKGR